MEIAETYLRVRNPVKTTTKCRDGLTSNIVKELKV